jgi:hypothetical protein
VHARCARSVRAKHAAEKETKSAEKPVKPRSLLSFPNHHFEHELRFLLRCVAIASLKSLNHLPLAGQTVQLVILWTVSERSKPQRSENSGHLHVGSMEPMRH